MKFWRHVNFAILRLAYFDVAKILPFDSLNFAFLSETHLEIPVAVTVRMEASAKNVEATVQGLSNKWNSTTRSQ